MGLFVIVWLWKWGGRVSFKLHAKSMLASIDRLRQGRVKKLIGMTHKFSLGESILQRIAHEIRHRFDDVRQQPHRVGLLAGRG